MKTYTLTQASDLTGLDQGLIENWINEEWISPAAPKSLDIEDIARLRFIQELQHDFGLNEAAIPLILHLVDQLCHYQVQFRRLEEKWI